VTFAAMIKRRQHDSGFRDTAYTYGPVTKASFGADSTLYKYDRIHTLAGPTGDTMLISGCCPKHYERSTDRSVPLTLA